MSKLFYLRFQCDKIRNEYFCKILYLKRELIKLGMHGKMIKIESERESFVSYPLTLYYQPYITANEHYPHTPPIHSHQFWPQFVFISFSLSNSCSDFSSTYPGHIRAFLVLKHLNNCLMLYLWISSQLCEMILFMSFWT